MFTIRSQRLFGRIPRATPPASPARGMLQVIAFCAALVAIVPEGRAAEKLVAADRLVIEQTIRAQLDAFVRDDAERAFGFATPEIRRQFGSSDVFMAIVREHYEPVYRPGSVQFVRLDAVDGDWVQVVQIADDAGHVWRALFTMKRQPDRTWRVGGCRLVQTRAIST